MRSRLPAQSMIPLPTEASALVDALQSMMAHGQATQGYVRAELPAEEHFLFILRGKAFCAGAIEGERFVARPIADFFRAVAEAEEAEFYATDLALFLCTAVLFRKAPSAQIPLELMDSDILLRNIKQTGKDAVLVIRRGDARSLVFCRGGEPAVLYPARDETFGLGGEIADSIVEYVYSGAGHREVVIDLYDEIQLGPTADAGREWASYLQPAGAGRRPAARDEASLIVKLGERVVFRYPLRGEVTTIGRGADNDLPLDNLSVSRRHARALRRPGLVVIEDLSSDNGLVVDGQRVARAELRPGQAVQVGRYTLEYPDDRASKAAAPLFSKPRGGAAPAVEETILLQSSSPPAAIEHHGQRYPLRGSIFLIGTASHANLRLRGWFIAPIHAKITRGAGGIFRLEHVAGLKKVRVNGQAVASASLAAGDRIEVAGEELRFHLG